MSSHMLRITTHEDDDGATRLRIEGRVTGDTMSELRSICETRLGTEPSLVLDVAGVAYADASGAKLLRTLEARGASVIRASGFLSELMRRTDLDRPATDSPATGEAPRGERDGEGQPRACEASAAGSDRAVVPEDPDADTDEQALVARLRAGDELAFELAVRRFAPRLLAVARRMLDSQDDAQDAVQEAFLCAFRGIHAFSGEARLSTWLHRIIVNASLMRLRSQRRRAEDSIEDLLPRFGDDGQWLEAPVSWRGDDLLERKQARAVVRRCIERLPATHREVLMLRDIEDLDTDEVSELLGISTNAVKVRLHRARQALRTLIERELVTQA